MPSVEINFCFQTTLTFKSLLTVFWVTSMITLVSFTLCIAECPENLRQATMTCFDNYGTQRFSVDHSGQRLFSGIDIEILRAYCSSYIDAMLCVQQLKNDCPASEDDEIKMTVDTYYGQEELQNLCRTKDLYELYAQYMNCFAQRGKTSDLCFDRSNVAAEQSNQLAINKLCSRLQNATQCIESNIYQGCGNEAKELVHLLVRSTVRGSLHCPVDVLHVIPATSITRQSNGGVTKQAAQKATVPTNSSSVVNYNIVLLFLSIFISNSALCCKPRGFS